MGKGLDKDKASILRPGRKRLQVRITTARHRLAAGRHNRVMYLAEDYIGHLCGYMVVENLLILTMYN